MVIPPNKWPISPSPEALFRYSILSQIESLVRTGKAAGRALREVAGKEHADPGGGLRSPRVRTIQRWQAEFDEAGLPGLEPKQRNRIKTSDVLPDKLISFLEEEKGKDPRASVPELIRRARVKEIIPEDLLIDRTTVWRTITRMGIPTRVRPSKREGDSRRFAYPHRMQCLLCDGKHFRAGAERRKRVALFFLDDCTRYGMDVIVGTSESTELFLEGLYGLVCKRGLFDLAFMDRGPGFISGDTISVIQSGLGAWLVHGRKNYPEGHGKIEKFNQTAGNAVLRSLDGAADVDPECGALTLRLRHFLERDYNHWPHESLSKGTPRMRWETDQRALRFPEDELDLRSRFVVTESRTVSKDHIIKASGGLWEAPRGMAQSQAIVIRHVLDKTLHVEHQGKLLQLHEVDLHANAYSRRGYPDDQKPLPGEGVPLTAATLTFKRDFAPIVGPDGGYTNKEQ